MAETFEEANLNSEGGGSKCDRIDPTPVGGQIVLGGKRLCLGPKKLLTTEK